MLNYLTTRHPGPPPSPPMAMHTAPFQWMPAGVAFIRRRLWPILGCAALGLTVGAIYVAVATHQYTAISTIIIDARRAHPVGGQQPAGDWQSESAYVESQVELIRSHATLRGVVEQLNLDRDPLFAPQNPGPVGQFIATIKSIVPGLSSGGTELDGTARAQAMATTSLSSMLEVWRVGTTSVVEVRTRTPDRALSARLANAVTDAYMAQQLVAISETTRRAGTWLQGRIVELRGQAVTADRAVQEYKAKNNIIDVGTGAGTGLMNEQQLGELNVQVAHARSRVAETQARYQRAQASTVNGITQGVGTDAIQNTVMTRLRQQYLDASRREADLISRQGPTHNAVVLQQNEVRELQRSIQSELARITETYRGDFEVAQANLSGIQARLVEQVANAAQTNIERSELRSLQSSADAYRQIYENFLQRFTQAMQDQSYPISDARVAAVALAPKDRSQPKILIALAVALTIGLALGVVIAVVREALDATIRTVAQLRQATGLDCLGVVPQSKSLMCRPNRRWLRASRHQALHGHLLLPTAFRQAVLNPDSGMALAVHGVRVAAARQSTRGRDVRVIGCVSVLGGEGASTFAANLAAALMADGMRTVLVDWNAKDPSLTKVIAPHMKLGVQELAVGESTLTDVALTDSDSTLSFIGQSQFGGQRSMPGTAKVRAMMAALRDRHDFVVLSLPPMQPGGAAVLLSDIVDGFVLVARWGSTPAHLLSEALTRTASMDALFLGTVLNGCDTKRMRLYPRDPSQSLAVRTDALMAGVE